MNYEMKGVGVCSTPGPEKRETSLDSYAACHDISMIPGHKCPNCGAKTFLLGVAFLLRKNLGQGYADIVRPKGYISQISRSHIRAQGFTADV